MKMLYVAAVVGLILAIPLLFMINYGFERLGKSAENLGAVRELMEEVGLAEGGDIDPIDSESIPPASAFPINRSISNYQGKTIDVIITGRGRSQLQFYSLRYNRDYSYPILQLSLKDQWFVRRLPIEEMDAGKSIPGN